MALGSPPSADHDAASADATPGDDALGDAPAFADGTVTKLAAQQHHPDRASVFIDGQFAFGVHHDLVLKYGLHAGRALSAEEQREIVDADQVSQAKERAFAYLAHKPRTEAEVRRKLADADYADWVIDRAVERLTDLGYLDDAAYAEAYVRNRFANKGYGPRRLASELARRGLDRHAAQAAVDAFFAETDGADPLDAARAAADKRWRRFAREDDPQKRKGRLSRYLQRRGFGFDVIYRVIDEMEARRSDG
jgi:regulatory protein